MFERIIKDNASYEEYKLLKKKFINDLKQKLKDDEAMLSIRVDEEGNLKFGVCAKGFDQLIILFTLQEFAIPSLLEALKDTDINIDMEECRKNFIKYYGYLFNKNKGEDNNG